MSNETITTASAELSAIPSQPTSLAQPLPRPGHRMVPATIGWPGRQTVVLIEDPTWCVIDHLDNWQHALEDVDHYGDDEGWNTDSILQPGDAILDLYARLHTDPIAESPALREAHVVVGDGGAKGDCYLTPEMAERCADELIAFAASIRTMARAARQANAAVGRKPRVRRSQADEALRRARGGAL